MTQDQCNIKNLLAAGQTYVGVPFGVSMWPMLRNKKDVIVIQPLLDTDVLKKDDIAVFERSDGALVMHRIVDIKQDAKGQTRYLFWGDNCAASDGLIPRERILGRLSACTRSGKDLNLQRGAYRAYVKVWGALRPGRVVWKRARALCGRTLRKMGLRK